MTVHRRTAGSSTRARRLCGAICVALALWQGSATAQSEPSDEADGAGATTPQPTAAGSEAPRALRVVLQVGAGAQQRLLDVPSASGTRSLDSGFGPALSLRLAGRLRAPHHYLGARISYQTSIGMSAREGVPDATTQAPGATGVRSQRFEAGVLGGIRLGATAAAASLGLFLGYGLRAFESDAPLQIPRFSLHGPLLRLEFELPIACDLLALQLAPEVSQIVSVSAELREQAALARGGQSFGTEMSLRLRLHERLAGRLAYRESHARIRAGAIDHFSDVERYLLLELSYRWY
jgi:hypothetical protein